MTAATGSSTVSGRIAAASTGRTVSVSLFVLATAGVLAMLLAIPGETVTTKNLNDLFVLLDGTHRVVSGQVPNRDFHTALGPLAYYVPAAGYWVSGSLGAAIPVGVGLLILVLAPVFAHVVACRLHIALALPFATFVLFILATPINLGEGVTSLSFAKFYNRIGWAALAILLVMYLPPRRVRAGQDRLDALCAAGLTLTMLYTKATYGLAALGFLALVQLFDPRQRRWGTLAIGTVLVTGLVVEAVWQSSLAQMTDLLLAWQVDGGVRGSWGQIVDHLLGNLTDYVLLALIAGLALMRTRSVGDALFYGYCAVAGFLIINQNFQAWGIITLHAAAVVAAETILRGVADIDPPGRDRWSVPAGAKLLVLALVLPTIVHSALALSLHAGAAVTRSGQEIAFPNLDRVRLAQLWTWNDHEAAKAYLATIEEGVGVLADLDPGPDGVLVLDVANPFSAAVGLEPPSGDAAGLSWGRTVNAAHFLAPERMLADVQIVLEPKPAPSEDATSPPSAAESLRNLYGPYIAAKFDLFKETTHWRVHRRREPRCADGCRGAVTLPPMTGAP